jgi:hypothetical protein
MLLHMGCNELKNWHLAAEEHLSVQVVPHVFLRILCLHQRKQQLASHIHWDFLYRIFQWASMKTPMLSPKFFFKPSMLCT